MKSKGEQIRSYCYVADACTGILEILRSGSNGDAYNIANEKSIASIYEFAKQIADEAGVQVVFSDPSVLEAKGFSTVRRAVLNSNKLKALGWQPTVSLVSGISRTVSHCSAI